MEILTTQFSLELPFWAIIIGSVYGLFILYLIGYWLPQGSCRCIQEHDDEEPITLEEEGTERLIQIVLEKADRLVKAGEREAVNKQLDHASRTLSAKLQKYPK